MRFSFTLIALGVASTAVAQDAPVLSERIIPCDGQIISAVDIQRSARTVMDKQRAPGWARTVLQPLLLGAPTRAAAIAPFVQLHGGGKCTEHRRYETERLLRQLPYLADATVRVFDEADGRVRIQVETIDDIRPIIGMGLRESKPNDVELGNSNIGGSGQLGAVRWRDGRGFRDGFGARYANYHVLGGPNLAQVNVAQTPLGSFALVSLGRSFLTDLQHVAGYAGYVKDDGYTSFTRPDGDALSIQTARERADAGVALRLNAIGRVTYLVGALASTERRSAGDDVVRITDHGFVDTTEAALTGRYRGQQSTRAGMVLGLRALSFVKVRAFDGLEGVQDVGRGMQLATTIGKGISGDDRRNFATADFYTAVGGAQSFVGLRVQAEARQNTSGWGDGVASGRLAWYHHVSARQTRVIALEYAGSSSDSVPYQLTMADAQSGLRGYVGSRLSGGRRLIARGEQRINMPGISRYLGWGLAGFAEAGQMWAAKVPFGEDGFRSSVGLSLLAAVPRASRSVARVDVAYPLVADKQAKGVDIRVTYRITGRAFWREPTQIARARRGNPTTDIFTWP
ncbi:MAG: hypothetical protein IPP90_14920 [Gemmatimonadaceae bacterium]|nr:hypothetical protein [Gemmatimonadaceae bacterium]